MRYCNLIGLFFTLTFCFFACDDTVSSTDSSNLYGLDAIPGFNTKPYSSGNGETSSSGGSSSSFEESSASEESSSSEDSSSSSSEELSSSSISVQNPGTDIGTCGPEKDVVEKGSSVKWKFTKGPEIDATQLMKASFSWTFEGGSPATAEVTGTNGLNQAVTYTTSGDYSASLVISLGASTYNLTCSPVQVNGDPITGCMCSTSAASVDYTSTPDVAWNVTGCTTASDLSTYNWDGVDGGTTFTKSFNAPTASYAPVLKVGNTDNTVVDVTCTAVKVTEGPEYKIVATGNAGAIRLPAGSTMATLMVNAISNTVFCQGDSASGPPSGSVNDVDFEGNYYITASMPAETLVSGTELDFHLTEPATCGVQ